MISLIFNLGVCFTVVDFKVTHFGWVRCCLQKVSVPIVRSDDGIHTVSNSADWHGCYFIAIHLLGPQFVPTTLQLKLRRISLPIFIGVKLRSFFALVLNFVCVAIWQFYVYKK